MMTSNRTMKGHFNGCSSDSEFRLKQPPAVAWLIDFTMLIIIIFNFKLFVYSNSVLLVIPEAVGP